MSVCLIKFMLFLAGCMEEYFSIVNEKESQPSAKNSSSCKSVLYSKSKDESLV